MPDKNAKSYKELQLEELKTMYGVEAGSSARDVESKSGRPEDEEIATLYADAAEYEEELACMERELSLIKTSPLGELAASLGETFPHEAPNYASELKSIVLAGWKQFVEGGRTYPETQLSLIETTEFDRISETLHAAYPDSGNDFEKDLRDLLIRHWETHIEIKKEHIKEEHSYIKALGLKPHYAKRVYKRYHGIE